MDTIKKNVIETLVRELMGEWLGADSLWSFGWNNRVRAFGVCKHRAQVIELSWKMVAGETMDAIEQTILHEIAHAMVGCDQGHGPTWKHCAVRIGVHNPKSCRDSTAVEADQPRPKWVVVYGTEIVARKYRTPNPSVFTRMATTWVSGRKHETLGKCRLIKYSDHLAEVR